MIRYKTASNLLACLILVAATLRAFTLWAADPMLAYANNYDQIRTLKVFGLHPKDSPAALYAMTPERPWRHFVQAEKLHAPIYPSSDLIFKSIQFGAMAAFRDSEGVMDIKIASAPVLIGWLLGIWLIFRRLIKKPLAALGFAGWILLVADPINLLFLNTWYAEFSAFAIATLFVGIAWLWLFQLISLRWALIWGSACLAVLSFNRNQYMFLLPAVAGLAGTALALSRPYPRPSLASGAKWTLIAAACLLPMLVYNAAAKKITYMETATNRINTVFGGLLPASKDPTKMLENLGLSPEGCLRFSGQSLYSRPEDEFKAHCPKVLKLSLPHIAKAVMLEPTALVRISGDIAQHHNGFLQHHIGHVEGANNAFIDDGSLQYFNGREFLTAQDNDKADSSSSSSSSKPYYYKSVDPLLKMISADTTTLLIWLAVLGPSLAAVAAWFLKQRRWAFMFLLNGLLFNYALFSSILGDGYFELERHAILCFSFGGLFFVLLGSFAASPLSSEVSTRQ